MNQKKILHLANNSKRDPNKFLPDFIRFVQKNFDTKEHLFIFTGPSHGINIEGENIVFIDEKFGFIERFFFLLKQLLSSKKIILHRLPRGKVLLALHLMPSLLKKSAWVIWGGDLYKYKDRTKGLNQGSAVQKFLRRRIISKLGFLATYLPGDVAYAREWYGAKGTHIECIMYPSNLFTNPAIEPKEASGPITLQIGNSANSRNNHMAILKMLEPYKERDIKIFAPLSYGDMAYGEKVGSCGKELFGEKFVPLTQFLPLEAYKELLASVDIAIFYSKHQHAMGNIITLLGLGKKVYIMKDTTPWDLFSRLGVCVFDVEALSLDLINPEIALKNSAAISKYFSAENLKKQLEYLFGA